MELNGALGLLVAGAGIVQKLVAVEDKEAAFPARDYMPTLL